MSTPTTITIFVIALSLSGWAHLLVDRWRSGGPLLPHEPRRPVPWRAVEGVILAAFLLISMIAVYLAPRPLADAALEPRPTADQFISVALSNAVFFLILLAVVIATVVSKYAATPADLGLPRTRERAKLDALLGAKLGVLLLGPTMLLQGVMIWLFGHGSQNTTLLVLHDEPTWQVYSAAFFAAVIIAPIFEESVCRLLLQGWLEKSESQLRTEPTPDDDDSSANATRQLNRVAGLAGLTPGLAPILISSLVFSLLHLGAGPDVVPLFLFGVIQGYVYQRTHRVLPCIVSHAFFNAVSLTIAYITALPHG